MYHVGANVFFKHAQHSWIVGTISAADGDTYSCKANDPKRTEVTAGQATDKLKLDDLNPVQNDVLDEVVHDLLNLTILHDSTLLRCLYLRYMSDVIYTNIGAIVVALNPFNFKIPRYMDDVMKNYLAEGPQIQVNVPHSWAQAHNTYYEMLNDKGNQCILISGESGAGKTEAAKIVMKYLAAVSCLSGSPQEKDAGMMVGSKLNSCSPILEAFGNAKTVRNDNSSRFGKFVKVKFSPEGRLIGAHTTKYLLEKSRIVTCALNERCYHSFYVLVRGRFKSQLAPEPDTSYKSINSGSCLNNNEFNSAEDFDHICKAMTGVGMSEQEVKSVWLVPAGVLALQNVTFQPDGEGSVVDEASARFLQHTCRVWGVDEMTMRKELTTQTLVIAGATTTKVINVTVAMDTRDALCKAVYDGVFGWLVDKCNSLCDVSASGNWVGLLDIFGFENFEKNSFEQICINLTNETLQNHYNGYIFTRDMEECRAEGIDVTEILCPDNGPCLKMMAAQGGIISLLDEECSLGKGTDLSFLDKITSAHGSNKFFARKKTAKDTFLIMHYAADVTYDVNGFLDKNRDTLKDPVKVMMRKSTDPLVAICVVAPIPVEQKKGKALTVGGSFKESLAQLMELINSTNPHWIRCVKPHPAKKPKMFQGVETMNQLESSGVLGTVKIRKAGYPVRLTHDRFVRRYLPLAPGEGTTAQIISNILSAAQVSEKRLSQVGTTKVFLKSEAYQQLEKRREVAMQVHYKFLHRITSGFRGRQLCFLRYFEKHKARLMKEKKEREEKERAVREAAEAARRAAEDKERLVREAAERKRREEERKAIEKRNNAAIVLQKHIRGGMTRTRVLRMVLEEQRCQFEAQRERQMAEERALVREIDVTRIKSEKQWIGWLNEVDQLQRYMETERQRRLEKVEQKERILKREAARAEEKYRADILLEEAMARQTLVTRCEVIAKHKLHVEDERRRHDASRQQASEHPNRTARRSATPKSTTAARSTTSDARTEKLLADYALQRARAFEEYFPQAPPPAKNSFATRAQAWESASAARSGRGASPTNQRALFDRSKNRWEREEEWLDSRDAVLSREALRHVSTQPLDDMFSGPYRTVESLSPREPPQHAAAVASPNMSGPFAQTGAAAPPPNLTPSQRRAEDRLQSAVDWDSVFNTRLW